MATYIVNVREVHTQMVKVEALDADHAVRMVVAGDGEYLDEGLEYSHTLDPDTWTVENAS